MTPAKNKSGLSAAATVGIALGCAIPVIALVIILLMLVSHVFDSNKKVKNRADYRDL